MSKRFDLSILIPARNEEFLKNTVEDILKNRRRSTEVIVGLDGQWSNPPLSDHPDVTIFYSPTPLGQRAMTNALCRLSRAKYVAKCDAHVAFGVGFDEALLKGFEELGDNVTQVPTMYNLHVFDWKCMKCGKRTYQGRTPTECSDCDNKKDFKKKIVWKPRTSRKTEFWSFDSNLKFQYWNEYLEKHKPDGQYIETMSLLGAFFCLSREKYHELNICDEKHGSWGAQGSEVCFKTWLSGGRLITNRNTWYSHMFRTQGGDFGFPYPLSQNAVDRAREHLNNVWLNSRYEHQVHLLSWLVEKFWPAKGWSDKDLAHLKSLEASKWGNSSKK